MIVLLLALLGLILGSFVNAFVWRLYKGKDWVTGRSECTHCHHELAPKDLVPVFSWLWLHGRCRYCHKKIEDNPLVEAGLPVIFIVSYLLWPLPLEGSGFFEFVVWCIFLVGFMALVVYDFRWYLLPNKIVFPLIGLALAQVITMAIWDGDLEQLLMAFSGAIVVAGLFYALFWLSNGTWIGGGDVKLGVVLGLLAGGVVEGFLLLFLASVAGMLAALPLIIKGKAHRKTQLPFGPFLIIGLILVQFFSTDIIDWYTGLLYV
jgi:prepilin signal peptidase PulO-like enzyme (type II secretory pathway)